jgi:hypothetical protein
MGKATRNPSIIAITDAHGDAFTHSCMITHYPLTLTPFSTARLDYLEYDK